MTTENKKRQKIQKELILSQDETKIILDFLKPKEILNFALVNHQIYELIHEIAKKRSPEVIDGTWCFTKALSERFFLFTSKNANVLLEKFKFIDHLGNLNDFNIAKQMSIGNIIKILSFDMEIAWQNLFEILQFFPKVEEIRIRIDNVKSKLNYEETMKKLNHVKILKVLSCLDVSSNEICINILNLCPNVEHLTFVSENSGDDETDEEFIQHLIKFQNLVSIKIQSDISCTPICNIIPDQALAELINNLPHLKDLWVSECSQISGSFFSSLKENHSLKKLRIERNSYEQELIDEFDEIELKNYLHNLQELSLIGFNNQSMWKSFSNFCPKLELIEYEAKKDEMSNFDEYNMILNLIIENKFPNLYKFYSNWENDSEEIFEKLKKYKPEIQLKKQIYL